MSDVGSKPNDLLLTIIPIASTTRLSTTATQKVTLHVHAKPSSSSGGCRGRSAQTVITSIKEREYTHTHT